LRWSAYGNDGVVRLWDVVDRAHPRPLGQPLTGRAGVLASPAFSPDGRTLATISGDGTVILWDLSPPRARPRRHGQPLSGHRAAVTAAAFAPDGRTLATGSNDHTVILWDLSDRGHPRRLGQPLTGHAAGVASLAFAPDGRTLATSGEDQTVILWDLSDLDDLRRHAAEQACSLARRGLDRNEWARYVPDLPYQRTCPG
jgi:WD40 repeat protein